MVATVGFSRLSGVAVIATSVKLGELSGLATLEDLVLSNSSPGLASASFQSPVSVSRVSFHEFVALGNVTATERTFSILKKSLLSHWSGFGSMLAKLSEISVTLSESAVLT